MKNYTNCVIVNRVFYYEVTSEHFELVRIKEFLFKHADRTQRYCMVLDKKNSHIYEVTEHSADFFEKVVNASCGWSLYNLYNSQKIEAVPINNQLHFVNQSKRYQYLKEFYVIFNSQCNEKTMKNLANKAKISRQQIILYDSE